MRLIAALVFAAGGLVASRAEAAPSTLACPPPEEPTVYVLEYNLAAGDVYSLCPVDANDTVHVIVPEVFKSKPEVKAFCDSLGGTVQMGPDRLCLDIDFGV